MANSVVVKLQLQDELTPELKQAQKELEDLASSVLKTDRTLKELKSDKKGIIKGAIESDIKGVKELQRELKKYREQYESASKQSTRSTAKNKMAEMELRIEKLINDEIAKKTLLLKKQKDAEQLASKQTQKSLDEEIRKRRQSTKAIKSETNAIRSNGKSRMKEDAERRALGTTIVRQIRRMESLAVAYFAVTSAYKTTFGAGIELNRQYQSMEIGLSAILASKTKAIDVYGKEVGAMKKFNIAQSETEDTLKKIKKASLDTPATFEQMVGFYQQAIGHALKAGKSFGDSIQEISDNTITLTKRMSNLGSAVGMPMDRINEEIRSLMSGNASTDSLLASILFGSPAAANKAIKEAKTRVGGLQELLDDKLSPFKAVESLKTYDKAFAHLKASMDNLRKSATKNMFHDIESGAENLSKIISSNSDQWAKQIDSVYQIAKKLAPAVEGVVVALLASKTVTPIWKMIRVEMLALDTVSTRFTRRYSKSIKTIEIVTRRLKISILAAGRALKSLLLTNAPMIALTVAYEAYNHVLDENIDRENKIDDILSKKREDLEKLTVSQLKYNKTLIEEDLANLKKQRRDKSIEIGGKIQGGYIWDSEEENNKKIEKLRAEEDELNVKIRDRKKTLSEIKKSLSARIVIDSGVDFSSFGINKEMTKQTMQTVLAEYDKYYEEQKAKFSSNNDALIALESKYLEHKKELLLESAKLSLVITEEKTKEQIRLEKAWAKEEQSLMNEIGLSGLDGYKRQFKQLEQWHNDELSKYKSIVGAKETIDEAYAVKKNEIINAQAKHEFEIRKQSESAYLSIIGTDSEKANAKIAETISKLGESGTLTAQQLQEAFDALNKDYEINLEIKGLDETQEKMDKMYDSQIDLIQTGMDWGNSLKGTAKDLANVSKAVKQHSLVGIKSEKSLMDLSSKYTKKWLELENSKLDKKEKTKKQDELYTEFKKDADKEQINRQMAEIDAYANLAGAMSGFFEAGSSGAQAMQAVQATLGIVNGITAILGAWASAPFPYNLPAIAATTSAVLPMIAQLTSLGGSGGSGGSSKSTYKINTDNIKNTDKPILDKFDRQIALLESIDKNGSASRVQNTSSKFTFNHDYRLLVEDSLKSIVTTAYGAYGVRDGWNINDWDKNYQKMEQKLGFNFMNRSGDGTSRTDQLHFDTSELRKGFNFLKLLSAQSQPGGQDISWIYQRGWEGSGLNPGAYGHQQINLIINKFQKALGDYTKSVVDSLNTLKDASKDFKDSYDKITGSMYYENKKLREAYGDVAKLTGKQDFASYLKDQVTEIDGISKFFSKKNISILMNEDPSKLTEQLALVDELQAKTGLVFKNGASDALDYLDSIKLVSEAMGKSRENIKSFEDSFKSKDELVADMAKSLGVATASTKDSLMRLFNTLKGGVGGLTDQELEFLNANKDLLESQGEVTNATEDYQNALDSLTNSLRTQINSVHSMLNSVGNAINSVTGARNKYLGITTSRSDVLSSLNKFNSLSGSKKYAETSKMLSTIQSYYNAQKKAIQDNTKSMINGLNRQEAVAEKNYQSRYNALKKEHDAIESINGSIKSLYDFADSLILNNTNMSPAQSMAMWAGVFNSSYGNLSNAIAANNVDNVNKFSSDVQTYSQSYIDSAKVGTSTAQEYELIVGQIADKLKATDLKDNTTLGDVNAGLASIKASFNSRIASLQSSQETSINALNKEAASWLDEMNGQLKDEQTKLLTINDALDKYFPELQQPVNNIDLALEEMRNNQLTLDEVTTNIANTESHYRRLESLLEGVNQKLNKVADNTDKTADAIFTQGVA